MKQLELNSEHLSAYEKRGLAQIELKDYRGAIANYTQVIENNNRVNKYRNTDFYQWMKKGLSFLTENKLMKSRISR